MSQGGHWSEGIQRRHRLLHGVAARNEEPAERQIGPEVHSPQSIALRTISCLSFPCTPHAHLIVSTMCGDVLCCALPFPRSMTWELSAARLDIDQRRQSTEKDYGHKRIAVTVGVSERIQAVRIEALLRSHVRQAFRPPGSPALSRRALDRVDFGMAASAQSR